MSTSTNALNVAGSIGGVAQSASNLASLFGAKSGSWAASLQTASFGGVKFGIEAVRTLRSPKVAVHDYPFRVGAWVEHLGGAANRFEVNGFIVENDIITKQGAAVAMRQALLDVCADPFPNEFIHPTMGKIENVICLSVETLERKDLGLVFEIRLSLIITQDRIYPSQTIAPGNASASNASLTGIAALLNFVKTTASAIQAGAAIVQQAVSTAVGWYQFAVTAVNDVKNIIGAVSTLFGNFGRLFGGANNGYADSNVQALPSVTADDLLSAATANRSLVMQAGITLQAAASNPGNSAVLGAAVQGLVSALAAAAVDPADAVRMLSAMAQYQPAAVTTPGQIGASMLTMQVAMSALFRRYALAQLAVTLTTYQPSSQNDAETVLSSVTTLFDSEITTAGDAGDDESYLALRALRQSVIADMTTRAADLSTIATFSFQASLPSLVLAQRIYRDPSREPSLVQQINPIHPAFCPTIFQALAS